VNGTLKFAGFDVPGPHRRVFPTRLKPRCTGRVGDTLISETTLSPARVQRLVSWQLAFAAQQ